MTAKATILVVEDDKALRRSLAATLKAAGYHTVEAANSAEGLRWVAHHRPDVILLDLGLPDGDGLEFIGRLRPDDLTPIVVMSARNAEATKVAAFDLGADDYVTKPFGLDELLARIRTALRHGVQAKGADPIIRTGGLEIDLGARIVRRDGVEIELSPKEYELLAALALQAGKVVRHQDLLQAVWGNASTDVQYLRVYVGQLRNKIEADPSAPRLIVSDPGVGYRLISTA